jgi:hypothetical protein
MRAGEFPDGARVLRAGSTWPHRQHQPARPGDVPHPHAAHPRTGDAWCIYPTYDFAHGQSDAIEGITHSLCTLEFEDHRPLYDWLLDACRALDPRQYEFARLNLTYTVLSKRFLLRLVNEGHVRGWDDPRMPTLSGLRRRGFPAEASAPSRPASASPRDRQRRGRDARARRARRAQPHAPRRIGVLDPLKVVIENYPEGQVEEMEAVNNPEDPPPGTRKVPFSRELYIERDDFMEEPPPKFFRLAPAARCGCATPTSSPAWTSSRTRPARSSSCAAPTTRRRAAATRPTAAGQGDAPLGVGRARRPPRSASTTTSSHRAVRAARLLLPDPDSAPARSCSTGRSRSGTPGRRCRRRGAGQGLTVRPGRVHSARDA